MSNKFPTRFFSLYQYVIFRRSKMFVIKCMETNDQDKAIDFYCALVDAGVEARMFDGKEII